MARADEVSVAMLEEPLDAVRRFFEPQLVRLGLGQDEISKQSLEELQASRERIDEAILKPEQFGTVRLQMAASASAAVWVATVSTQAAHLDVGVLPLLLERKRLILERIRELTADAQMVKVAELLERVPNSEIKQELQRQEAAYQTALQQLDREAAHTDIAKAEAIASLERITEQSIGAFRALADIWMDILGRESIASVVGAVLILAFGVALMVAMFTGTTTSTVVTNSFLLILGYFFGQTAGRRRKR